MNRAEAIDQAKLLNALIELNAVSKILSTFIPAFKKGINKKDGRQYLFGSFNLNGTISMRMSSSRPNLQNIPSTGTKYAKPIKQCFSGADGWVFCGADFNNLEGTAGALVTKDPNKLEPMIQGICGHCFNALAYYPELMPDIIKTKESINSIKTKYPKLRQASKTITFAANYFGTYRTFMENSGIPEDEAKQIEANFHELYKVTDAWNDAQLEKAANVGYVTLAFGGRLRTPILSQTLANTKSTPYEATAERRSAGNALIQSYGLLTNRAAIEFRERVIASKHRLDIRPVANIHDAIYLHIRNNVEVIKWVNDNLIECMEWDDLPELKHPKVKLGSSLEVFFPDWSNGIEIPNKASINEIKAIAKQSAIEYRSKKE